MDIKTEKVKLDVGGGLKMHSYVAAPEGGGARPAVIVLEEIFGVNAQIRDVADRVAREGYVAIAPDVHHRAAPEAFEYAYDDEGRKKGRELIPRLTLEGFTADLKATLAYLRARKDARGDRVGVMGFCIGGHLSYLAACLSDVRAAASFYGGGIASFAPGGGPPTVGRTGTIKGKVLCLFGAQDPSIPEAQISTIRKALEDHKIRHEIVVYPNAGHAFFRDRDPHAFRPDAAADAWQRVKKLFAEELAA